MSSSKDKKPAKTPSSKDKRPAKMPSSKDKVKEMKIKDKVTDKRDKNQRINVDKTQRAESNQM